MQLYFLHQRTDILDTVICITGNGAVDMKLYTGILILARVKGCAIRIHKALADFDAALYGVIYNGESMVGDPFIARSA